MTEKVRQPAVAGMFYPANRARLATEVDSHVAAAVVAHAERTRGVVAPHAGYIYSAPTAGYAFKALKAGLAEGEAATRVYLLGPAHRGWFDGVSTGDYNGFATPLGVVPVDLEKVRQLWALSAHFQPLPSAHEGEHCLEVMVPFLQRVLPGAQLVPMLFGQVDAREVGRLLAGILREEPGARVVVSTDLSHFNDYATAQQLDHAFLGHVLAGEIKRVVRDRRGACGGGPLAALMEVAAALGWEPQLLDYRNSGDTAGDKLRVVGYAAIGYTEAGNDG